MGRCVVLLRGVNVGGSGRLAMADLRALLEDLGGTDVRTYLQSGNAVLAWGGSSEAPKAETAHAVDAHSSRAARLLSSKAFPVVASARNWRSVLALHGLAST